MELLLEVSILHEILPCDVGRTNQFDFGELNLRMGASIERFGSNIHTCHVAQVVERLREERDRIGRRGRENHVMNNAIQVPNIRENMQHYRLGHAISHGNPR